MKDRSLILEMVVEKLDGIIYSRIETNHNYFFLVEGGQGLNGRNTYRTSAIIIASGRK